ncbi:hypothetical protein SKAU_G00361310 [Synaphobranchus kaupii]|uniref:Gypsy retrotransposon integrase-like protein 1 n=1 Tax=Synaphobranchus kaupii TaxID=118154 RepID=A0A9Q1IG42_SYNKA|nr:hypothetical protein SKAU_G00361310 [Synaphobranchus kaupii]
MAEFTLPPPAPFLSVPGEPPIPWVGWLEDFTVYLEAMDFADISDRRKTALLRHCLGTEGQRIFRALGSAGTYDEAVTLLTAHFAGKQRALLRRYKLRKRHQRPGESVLSYVTDLRDLARKCSYGALQDQIIRDQLIEGTWCEKIREKLLLEPDELTLDDAIAKAMQVESALECSSMLTASSRSDSAPTASLTQQLQPAYQDSPDDTDAWFPVQQARRQGTYNKFFAHLPLQQPSTPLCGYDNSKIEIVGILQVPVHYGSKHMPAFPFHIAKRGANLLGLDLFTGLGFSLHDDGGSAIQHVTSTWEQKWPALFDGLGCLTAFTHRPLVNAEVSPVMQPLRRIPLALRDDVTKELNTLLEAGIIEPVNAAPWISNLVIAKKKSGGLRVCVDLRSVNKAVIPDKYPLPTSEELTTHFYGSTVFTKLDLRQGYLQVPLHPASRDLTAFISHAGVFRYTRMPFGLSSAPSCFQKAMNTILAGIPGVAVYLDDIVVHAPDMSTHDERLHRVFVALLGNSLTLNSEKCSFAAAAIDFVGFRLTAKGIAPLLSNVDAIHRIPEPTSASQVASFLGMTAYYLRFLPQYSQTTAPLRQLLKKEEPWNWTAACSRAFHSLKTQLTTPPILAHFDPSSPTLVTCDASAGAVGAVLSQVQDGVERPVAFASRALNPTEQRYSVGEREALACVWACERWHLYLYGRRFNLRTDHQALTTLLSASGSGHRPLRLHRWGERLRQYDYQLRFTPGRDNVVADLLSRSIEAPTPTVSPEEDTEPELIQMLHGPLQSAVSLEELQRESEQDPLLSTLCIYIRTGWPSRVPEGLAPFAGVRHELSCWGNVCVSRGLCTVVPSGLRARVLSMAHEGHLGIVRVKQRCRDLVWWPGIDRDIETMVKDCVPCLLSGKSGSPASTPLQPTPWPPRPWEHLQLDICGEIHGRGVPHHQRFLVVAYDLHSKWPEVVPAGTVTTRVIIDILEGLFARWGLPLTITTDNGPQFISAEFSDFLRNKGIKHNRTAYFHPQANGGVERFNQSLKNGIRAHLFQGCTFQAALNQTLLHYRATQHATTQASPASLMLGREMDLPLDRLRSRDAVAPAAGSVRDAAQAAVAKHQGEMKRRFDKK